MRWLRVEGDAGGGALLDQQGLRLGLHDRLRLGSHAARTVRRT